MKPTRMMTLAVAALLACGGSMALGAEPALEGTYTATGVNPDGSEYHRIVKIVSRGESFLVAWILPEREEDGAIRLVPTAGGVGVVSGGMLAVSFYGQDITGVILYRIEDGGARLVGRWVEAEGNGVVRTETLSKVKTPATAAPDTDHRTLSPPPRQGNPYAAAAAL